MEVTSIDHTSTHAVIGGGPAFSYAINDSPEFYEMLSATMYSNKKLAVAREVLCNAWDAHLMVGKSDTPVEVSISENEMIIRDFGPGISAEKIGPIYCVYGNSTKTHDGTQTGGFGLGSKAPYAYTKHFTVVSCHNGTRSVYAASRGTVETNGKPDFRLMVAVPCGEETGLTVTIPIADRNDVLTFTGLIKSLAFEGGMRVKLDGNELPFIDYKKADNDFVIAGSRLMGSHHGAKESEPGIFVRYGAVAYKVDFSDEEMRPLKALMKNLSVASLNFAVILLAPPNSIGVTPSRESLSYTPKTVETLRRLIIDADAFFEKSKPEIRDMVINDALKGINKEVSALSIFAKFVGRNFEPSRVLRDFLNSASNDAYRKMHAVGSDHIIKSTARGVMSPYSATPISAVISGAGTAAEAEDYIRSVAKKFLRKKNPKLKRHFNQIEAYPSYQRSGLSSRRGIGAISIDFDVANTLYRLARTVERDFNVKVAYGKFNYDGFSEFTEGEINGNLRSFANVIIGLGNDAPMAGFAKVSVITTPSRAAAIRLSKSDRNVRNSNGAVLLLTKKKSDIEGAVAFMKRAGFGNAFDASNHKAVRETPVASQTNHLLSRRIVEKSPMKRYETPKEYSGSGAKFYIYGVTNSDKNGVVKDTHPAIFIGHQNWLIDTFGDIVVVHNAADARKMEKAGLKNICLGVIDEIQKLMDSSEGMRALIFNSHLVHSEDNFSFRNDLDARFVFNTVVGIAQPDLLKDTAVQSDESPLISIIDGMANDLSATYKMGMQLVVAALRESRDKLVQVLEPTMAVFKNKDLKMVFDAIYGWRLRDANEAIVKAMITATIEAAVVQLKLSPKESKES